MSFNFAPRGCATPTMLLGVVAFLAVISIVVLAAVFGMGDSLLGGGPAPAHPAPNAVPGGAGGIAVPRSSASPGLATAPTTVAATVPPISERTFGSGSTQAVVTGGFAEQVDLDIDTIRSYVEPEGLAWIAFGGNDGPQVLITFNEPEDTVTVAHGARFAKGVDGQCQFSVQVTDTLVSGHVYCPNATVYAIDGSVTGSATIELTFAAST
jgi:hypothetical protein